MNHSEQIAKLAAEQEANIKTLRASVNGLIFVIERVDSSDGSEQEEALDEARAEVKAARAVLALVDGAQA